MMDADECYMSNDVSSQTELADLLMRQVEACLQQAEQYFNRRFQCDQIRIDIRGATAGQYRHQRRGRALHAPELRFNPVLLQRYQSLYIEEVVPHECAHLVAYALYGLNIRPHGPEWQAIMRSIYGREPRVRHTYEVDRSPRAQIEYRCACPERRHQLSMIRHNKIRRGQMRYVCRECRSELRLPV
jgi:SprT protein